MKIKKVLGRLRAKIRVLLVILLLSSCNTIKKVSDSEFLLTKNNIYVDSLKVTKSEVKNLISQKPNTNVFGYQLRLNLYNLAKENPDSTYQNWLEKKPKRKKRLNAFFSKKQVNRLGESFAVKGFSNFLKGVGEPPVIIDTAKTKKSIQRLQLYYGTKGYFNNIASYDIIPSKQKRRAEINYKVDLGKPYIVDSLTTNIASSDLDSLYQKNKDSSHVNEKTQFNLSEFNKERQRLTKIFRNSGVYNFQESDINFDVLRDTTESGNDQNLAIQLNIKNLTSDSVAQEYKVHRFEKINVYADYVFNENKDSLKSIEHKGYTIYYKDKLRYKPDALTDAIFFEKGNIYRDIDRTRTQGQITNLNTFKYPNIDFQQDSIQGHLNTNIYLAARDRYSLSLDFDVSRSDIQVVGTAIGASVFARNVFGGAETLSFSLTGSIGILSDQSLSNETFTSEIGGDINLTFPRIWFPLNTEKIIPYYTAPQTRLSLGTNFQQNVGLDKQVFNTTLAYSWSPTSFSKNTLELLDIEFVRNTNSENFFNIYQNTFNLLDEIADDYENIAGFEDFFEADLDDPTTQNLSIPNGADGFINRIINKLYVSKKQQSRY